MSDLFKDILFKCDIPAELDTPLLNLCKNKAISCDDVLTILRTIPDDALAIIRTLESRSDASSESDKPEPIPISLNKIESILKSRYVTSRKGEKVKDSKTERGWKDYATKCRDTIRRLSNEFSDTLHVWKLNDLVDYIMSKQRCGHKWNASTAKTHLNHINTLFRHMTNEEKNRYGVDPDHLDYIRENQILCSEIINEVYEDQRLTAAEEKLIMSQEQLVTATDKYEQENPVTQITNHANFVVARTIFLGRVNVKDHPPRRLDSLTPKITSITPQDNYIDWDTGCLVLNDYKTVKMYGTYKMKLSDETLRIAALMRDYILKQGKRHLVGCDDNFRNYSYMLQDAFRRICGRPLSCNLLRKMYIDPAWATGSLRFSRERQILASKMGHSIATQQLIYTKRPCRIEPEEQGQEEVTSADDSGEDSHGAEITLEAEDDSPRPAKRQCLTHSQRTFLKEALTEWEGSEEYASKVRQGKKPRFSWKDLQRRVPELAEIDHTMLQAYGRHHKA